jgi:hypothetical protein
VFVCLILPFAIVALLVCAELVYVGNPANRPAGGTLKSFNRVAFVLELITLLAGLANTILIPFYLSEFKSYAASTAGVKVVVAVAVIVAYLVVLGGAFRLVLLMHLV